MANLNPIAFYEKSINSHRDTLERINKKCSMYFYSKLLFFLLAVSSIIIWIYYSQNSIVWIYGTLCFISYLVIMYMDGKEMETQNEINRKIKVLSNEIQNLNGNFTNDNGASYISLNHPYTFDIDVFGEKSLFHRINRTITKEGSKKLAQILSVVGCDKGTIKQRQSAISELERLDDLRISFQCIGKVNNTEDSIDFSPNPTFNINKLKWITRLSWGLTIASILCFIVGLFARISLLECFITLMSIISMNGFIAVVFFYRSGKIMNRLNSFITLAQRYSPIIRLCSQNKFESELLNNIQLKINEQRQSISKLYSMNELLKFRNNFIFWIIVNCFALLDIYVILKYYDWEKKHLINLPKLLQEIGNLDAFVSLSNYNFNHPLGTYPQFSDEGIECKNIYHPFLKTTNVIGNDYIQTEHLISIITGANMSGKSTFLRAIGINLVLANAGCRVSAQEFLFNPQIKLFTSMRTQDNVSMGKSYFNAEIDRMSQAIDYGAANNPTLLILDEVLKGTNSEDKLCGTLELLEFFYERNYMAMIATHDMGVTSLESKYGEIKFKNYCFEIELNNPITYTYKIKRGICKNRNASHILSHMLSSKK